VTTGTSSATFTLVPTNVAAAPSLNSIDVVMTAAGNTSLGTSRVFGVSAVGDVVGGADVSLSGNTSWWTWGANAITLLSPYFSTDQGSGVLSRFFFYNSGAAVSYSASCKTETGVTATAGSAATGTLIANGTTHILAKDVCSFSSGIRGSVVFTINSPTTQVRGLYSLGFNGNNNNMLPLVRPYNTNTDE